MCYQNCSFENRDGECQRRHGQLCPNDYDDENELAAAEQTLLEEKADHD